MNLQNKTVVVAGGGTGIGLGIARALADEGCQVLISGRRQEPLDEAVAHYKGKGRLLTQIADVGDPKSVESLVRRALDEFQHIDIFVNSAGVNVVKRSLEELSVEDWDYMMQVNASGAFYCLRAVLPSMRARNDGLIINVSSIAGKRSSLLGGIGYTAAKFAMTATGITAAREESKYGIRITNIYPGEVETPLLLRRPVPVSPEHRSKILQPEDVAMAVVMIASLPARAHIPELIIKPTVQDYY